MAKRGTIGDYTRPKLNKIISDQGGGLDCAECSGDDLVVNGDLTVAGQDIIIKYDDSNYVTLTVDSAGELTISPTSGQIKMDGEVSLLSTGTRIAPADGDQAILAFEMF